MCAMCLVMFVHDLSNTASLCTGITESECHELYQKAITDNPTITLHIAKAMTIGPPRVGKTALRHLLLELPLPEVSISTPVMKTAETVGILTLDEIVSSAEDELPRTVQADSHLIQMDHGDKWVIVNETSGILSLLSHLKERVDEAMYENSIQAPSEVIQPQAQSHLTNADSKQATNKPEQHGIKQSITSISTGATAEETTHVIAAADQLYELLQTPNIANITLPDAKLLQFLDCGGQLAYHDILPIFATIPAIYLHVFDLTQGLAACPEDQLCLDTAEGEVYSHARSPLSVADMMSRSVMTIKSLAGKRVQLPTGVLLSEPPQPHIIFVGTHLDELARTCKDMEPVFNSISKALQSASESEFHTVEAMVVKNLDQRLPAMFFPVTCQQNIHLDVGSHAIKRLKGRLKTIVSDVKVKVPVKWYLYQMLEISRGKEKRIPVHRYRDLYRSCNLTKVVKNLREFHTMIAYFHALGLLIHACKDDAHMHSEDSTCLIFSNPSYLFENITKIFHVQFLEEIRCEGSLRKLKLEGKLTEKTLKDLNIDSTQLKWMDFMDVLVHFFIGADIGDGAENEGRTLFIPSVLPVGDSTQPVASEQAHHFVVTFHKKSFVPCGVYTGAIARLQSLKDWKIILAPGCISRLQASFGIAAEDTVRLLDSSSHIRVELDSSDKRKSQEYRDTVITVIAKSYCFLFHTKPTEGEPCAICHEDPYLELGLTCHHCEMNSDHIATLVVDCGEAKTVRCTRTQNHRYLEKEHMELFMGIQHSVSVHGVTLCRDLQ